VATAVRVLAIAVAADSVLTVHRVCRRPRPTLSHHLPTTAERSANTDLATLAERQLTIIRHGRCQFSVR
jgi:hypothetical protein